MSGDTWPRRLGWTIVAVVAADWTSKFMVTNHLAPNGKVALVDGWLYFVRLSNAGVSFSMLAGSHGAWRTPLLVILALLGIVALLHFSRSIPERGARFALALVVAGATGNLGDRIVNGAVTDFLAIRWFPWVFNVADLAITTGAVLLALQLLPARKRSDAVG